MDLAGDAFFCLVARREMMMTTTTLMRMTQDKEDLGGGTDDRGSVNIVGAASIPRLITLE